ncbi:NADP oxidoreductase, partial [Lactococcus lactis subsp. lactis]|uniref:NADPH-dependent F420 reductase n=1 Tax=Lactococcus lactis TaxID=1358 RepID=UPI00223AC96B
MEIGIIGSGDVGQHLAKLLIKKGFEVKMSNSRGPESLETLATDLGIIPSNTQEVAKSSIVILAVRREDIMRILKTVTFNDNILVDATNQMKLDDFEFGSRLVATHASNAHVVKAFNTLYAR